MTDYQSRLDDIDARLQSAEQALAAAGAAVADAESARRRADDSGDAEAFTVADATLHTARAARHDAFVAHMALTDEGLRTATEALRQQKMERP